MRFQIRPEVRDGAELDSGPGVALDEITEVGNLDRFDRLAAEPVAADFGSSANVSSASR